MTTAKKRKTSIRKTSIYILFAVTLLVIVTAIFGFMYQRQYHAKTNGSIPPLDHKTVQVIEGIVTKINVSCSSRSIYPDEDTRADSICDGGESIRVDTKTFQTSTGGPGPGYYVNIDSVDLGDTVSVKYVINDKGRTSLNCTRCGVTVIKSANPDKKD